MLYHIKKPKRRENHEKVVITLGLGVWTSGFWGFWVSGLWALGFKALFVECLGFVFWALSFKVLGFWFAYTDFTPPEAALPQRVSVLAF